MTIISKLMRGVRGVPASRGAQGFYSRVAKKNQSGGPNFDESRRDYEQVRRDANRLGLF